ncbi:MAG: class I SAM-dependent methyltransferase, partial [Chloroflexota bacterium]
PRERASLTHRAAADLVHALALLHHHAIGRNRPLPMIAPVLAELAPAAIVEWVPRGDPMVERLLAGREDIFTGYDEDGFRAAFAAAGWTTVARIPVDDSTRVLYRFART